MQIRQEKGCYTLYKENEAIGTAVVDGTTILRLEVVPRWRGRGSCIQADCMAFCTCLFSFTRTAASWCAAACPTCPPCSSAMRF